MGVCIHELYVHRAFLEPNYLLYDYMFKREFFHIYINFDIDIRTLYLRNLNPFHLYHMQVQFNFIFHIFKK